MTIYLDTHVLVWLFRGESDKLDAAARQAIERRDPWFRPPLSWSWNYCTKLAGYVRPR